MHHGAQDVTGHTSIIAGGPGPAHHGPFAGGVAGGGADEQGRARGALRAEHDASDVHVVHHSRCVIEALAGARGVSALPDAKTKLTHLPSALCRIHVEG